MANDLHELSRLEDSLTYLYIDRAIVERNENSIVIIREKERVPIPDYIKKPAPRATRRRPARCILAVY